MYYAFECSLLKWYSISTLSSRKSPSRGGHDSHEYSRDFHGRWPCQRVRNTPISAKQWSNVQYWVRETVSGALTIPAVLLLEQVDILIDRIVKLTIGTGVGLENAMSRGRRHCTVKIVNVGRPVSQFGCLCALDQFGFADLEHGTETSYHGRS